MRRLLQVRHSDKTPLMTCLLEGPPGVGKTALAATVGINSDFPFVKVRLVTFVLDTSCPLMPYLSMVLSHEMRTVP